MSQVTNGSCRTSLSFYSKPVQSSSKTHPQQKIIGLLDLTRCLIYIFFFYIGPLERDRTWLTFRSRLIIFHPVVVERFVGCVFGKAKCKLKISGSTKSLETELIFVSTFRMKERSKRKMLIINKKLSQCKTWKYPHIVCLSLPQFFSISLLPSCTAQFLLFFVHLFWIDFFVLSELDLTLMNLRADGYPNPSYFLLLLNDFPISGSSIFSLPHFKSYTQVLFNNINYASFKKTWNPPPVIFRVSVVSLFRLCDWVNIKMMSQTVNMIQWCCYVSFIHNTRI